MNIEEIYELYFKDVYAYIFSISKNRSIAEDITQETFYKALKNIHSFDGKKDIRAWLFTIAKNTFYTYCKKENKYLHMDTIEQYPSAHDDILEKIIHNEQIMLIYKYLHMCKEPYKEVFMLRYFGELSFEKIALIFNKSETWSRVTYFRAKQQILEKIKEEYHEIQ